MVVVAAGAGRLQETVMTWYPAAQLMTTRAFRPTAMQCSYSPMKLAAVTARGCLGHVDLSPRAPTSALTTLAHVGEPGEAGWRRGVGRPGWLACNPPEMGEARWQGVRQVDCHNAFLLHPPPPAQGEAGSRAGISMQEGRSSPDEC